MVAASASLQPAGRPPPLPSQRFSGTSTAEDRLTDQLWNKARAQSGRATLREGDLAGLCAAEPGFAAAVRSLVRRPDLAAADAAGPWGGQAAWRQAEPQAGTRRRFVGGGWAADEVAVQMEAEPFAQGSMRQAFRCVRRLPSGSWRRMVAKRYRPEVAADRAAGGDEQLLRDDVRLQVIPPAQRPDRAGWLSDGFYDSSARSRGCRARRARTASALTAWCRMGARIAPGEYVIKCRFQSKRAQRYIRLQLLPSAFSLKLVLNNILARG